MRDVITAALAHEVDLEVLWTAHRGHAVELGAQARAQAVDLVITLGGDGTINETVNGLLRDGPAPGLPILATIPGGSANVLARALGFPTDQVEATGLILESIEAGTFHRIGLGLARFTPVSPEVDHAGPGAAKSIMEPADQGAGAAPMEHWFTINAGVGLDADVIRAMEEQRAAGHTASGIRYLTTAASQYLWGVDRHAGNLSIHRPGVAPIEAVNMAIICNTAPWTYLGSFPINPCPQASFELGLDVFAPHSLSLANTVRYGSRMLRGSRGGSVPNGLTVLHDQPFFEIRADRPTALQIDGEAMGQVRQVTFTSVPKALRIAG
jgi:diacylglycerol kinase family enzyme